MLNSSGGARLVCSAATHLTSGVRSGQPPPSLKGTSRTFACFLRFLSGFVPLCRQLIITFQHTLHLVAQGYSLNCLFLLFIHCIACITATVRAVTLSKRRPECHTACTETGETKCEWPLHIDGRFMPLLFALPPFYLTCAGPKSWTKEASW